MNLEQQLVDPEDVVGSMELAKHAVMVGGINEWALMKIDVLDELYN